MADQCNTQAQNFTLKSPDLGGQATVNEEFDGFGCTGKNLSPELIWSHPQAGAKSFAITMYDPDAPTGSGWWHWLVFNIPANINKLERGFGSKKINEIGVIQSITDYGKTGYGGPCPPAGHGIHEYMLTVYALNVEKLDLDEHANPATVGFNINAHMLAKASLVIYYKR